jgi:membrane protease YdiL (CAAX protease family)
MRAWLAWAMAGWAPLAAAAWVYARWKSYPAWAALPIAAAFLIEFPFYILPAFKGPREWLARLRKPAAAFLFAMSAMAPWVVYSIATGEARWHNLELLAAVSLLISFWYVGLRAAPVTDLLFLGGVAAIYLSKVFDTIYLSPIPKLQLSVLGHLMLIRTAAVAVLVLRGGVQAEYRFIPSRAEWWTGLRYFAMMLPVIAAAYWSLGLVRWRAHPSLIALAAFPAVLWVLALSEEFFFRGLLQQWIGQWTGSAIGALIAASVLFGCAHLGFHRIFPNWRWAIVAGILGIFCGLAWRNSRSVQAAMVTHALTVTLWQVFLQQ